MGNYHSSNLECTDLFDDEKFKKITSEAQTILENLESLKLEIPKDLYANLKIKFMEFYTFTQINDGMIKRLSVTNADLENTLSEYKKELLKYEQEKTYLNKTCNQKKSELVEKLSTEINARKKLEVTIQAHKNKCEALYNEIKKLQDELAKERGKALSEKLLRQKAESRLTRQNKLIKPEITEGSEISATEYLRSTSKRSKVEQSELAAAKQRYDLLKKEMDIKIKKEKELLQQIVQLTNSNKRLNLKFKNAQSSCKQQGVFSKEAEIQISQLERQILGLTEKMENKREEFDKTKKMCAKLTTELEAKIVAHERDILRYEAEIKLLKADLVKEKESCQEQVLLREAAINQALSLKEKFDEVTKIEKELQICQGYLEVERNARHFEADKARVLKKALDLVNVEKQKLIEKCTKKAIHLNRLKQDLSQVRSNCQNLETLKNKTGNGTGT